MLNSFRQVGITLSVAILGAFVLNRLPGHISSQLTQRGVPSSISTTIADKVAAAGANAAKIPLPKHFPISQLVLHQTINQAFVDSIKEAWLIIGIAMVVTAFLSLALLQGRKPATDTNLRFAEQLPKIEIQPRSKFRRVRLVPLNAD